MLQGGQVHLHISLYKSAKGGQVIYYGIHIPRPQNVLRNSHPSSTKVALMLSLSTTLTCYVQMNSYHNNLTARKEKHNLDSENMDTIFVVCYTQ